MAKKTTSSTTSSKRGTSGKASTPEQDETTTEPATDATPSPEEPTTTTAEGATTPVEEEVVADDDSPESAAAESGDTAEDTPDDDEARDGEARDGEAQDDETVDTVTEAAESPDTPSAPEDEATPAEDEPRRGGVLPMLLGGVLAGLIGLGAGYYVTSEVLMPGGTGLDTLRSETDQRLQAQAERLSALADQVAAAPAPGDLDRIETELSDLRDTVDALTDRLAGTETALTALTGRLDTLETRPLTEGASDAAVAAYEAELKKLQEAMAAQRAEIEQMTARAQEMEDNAEATAEATMRRAALSRIQTALDAGGGYADALADLQATGMQVPEVLSRSANDGVATLDELQASFPEAARAALAAARDAAAQAGETGGLTAFLRNQLGARSLQPREGNDPDAILSRAEAAARDGRLTDALAEIDALPEVARAELSGWADQAARRLEAVAAAQKLSEELN